MIDETTKSDETCNEDVMIDFEVNDENTGETRFWIRMDEIVEYVFVRLSVVEVKDEMVDGIVLLENSRYTESRDVLKDKNVLGTRVDRLETPDAQLIKGYVDEIVYKIVDMFDP